MPTSLALRRAGRTFTLLLALLIASLLTCASAFAATTGEQKTAVILVNFQDNTLEPISRADAHALVFGTVSDYYWEASYQKTFLTGDTFGWYTLPISESSCNTTVFAQEADKMAAAAGVDLSKYSRLIYLVSRKVCLDGGVNSGTTLPTRMWATATNFDEQLIIHELGHNFGLLHSAAIDCGPNVMGAGCTGSSYGDPADTMGSGFAAHFNATHKEKLGWLNGSGQPPITTVAASGTFVIAPFETTGTTAKALKIPRGVDPDTGVMGYYYLEYRQPIGFDAGLGAIGNLTQGVLVHTTSTNSNLLDMTPDSVPSSTYNDMRDAALTVGRNYVDSVAGVSITVKSADANGATVEVSLNGTSPPATCTRAAPTLSLSGPTVPVAAGSTVNYTVSLGNRDSSGCGATSFNLARSIPAGWTGTLAAASLTLSPGSNASTTLSVSSPGAAAAGSYGIGVGAGSGAGGVHTANASTTYSVAAPAVGTLTGTVATDKATYARGETVAMSARVLDNGVPVNGASVRFSVTQPSGGSTVINATSGSDGFARGSLKIGKAKSATGNYQLRADASIGGSSTSATTVFAVR